MRKLFSTLSSTLQGGLRGGLLFLALMATTCLWAYDFQYGDLYYNITSSSEPYTVEVTSNSYIKYTGSVMIPETVTYDGTTYSVTSIGDYAFAYCESLTSVTIPNSVTSIGDWAFAYCLGLTAVTIGNSVTSIGDYAFAFGSGLTSVVVEEGNTVYDSRENCNAIIETESNTLIVGCQNTIIPNSVTSIGDFAFAYCSGLTSVEIPNSVTSIGDYAFANCFRLTSVEIPNSVTSIGDYAFDYCSGLTSVTIPNSVTSIGDGAFYGCFGLTSVTIPNSVTSIGEGAFASCESLKEVICYAEEVPELGEDVFYNVPQSEATLHVPASALGDYQVAEQWKEFGTILPIEETSAGVENTYNPSSTADTNKLLRNGQLIILRDGKTYTTMGAEIQ